MTERLISNARDIINSLNDGQDINYFLNKLYNLRETAVKSYTTPLVPSEEKEVNGVMYRVFYQTLCQSFENKVDIGAFKVLLMTRLTNDINTLESKFKLTEAML